MGRPGLPLSPGTAPPFSWQQEWGGIGQAGLGLLAFLLLTARLAPSWSSGNVLEKDRVPPIPAEPLCQGGNRSEEGALEWARSGHFLLATRCPFPLPPPPPLDPPSTGAGRWVLAVPARPHRPSRGSASPTGPGSGQGHHTIPRPPVPALLHSRGGAPLLPWALFGLTVTFLPELPARPPLAEMALPPTPHTLSRHKDQRSDGFSLSPAALGGGGGSPEPWDGKSLTRPPPQQPELYTGCSGSPSTPPLPPRRPRQASLLAPLALSSPRHSLGSSFQLQPPSTLLPPSALSLPGASSQSGF